MADDEAFAARFHIPKARLPKEPERLSDPKRETLQLFQKSTSRDVREGMVRVTKRGQCTTGSEYTVVLTAFADTDWRPGKAEQRAPSLRQARKRIAELAERLAL